MLCSSRIAQYAGKHNIEAAESRFDMARDDEATVVCPNCGALVPDGSPSCFVCDEKMPEQAPKEPRPSEPVEEQATAAEIPPTESGTESKAARLKAEYEAGAISEATYRRRLRSLGVSSPEGPEAEPSRQQAPAEVRPSADEAELQREWLKGDFESGKITKEAYVSGLRELGLPIPEELAAVQAPEEIPPEKLAADVSPEQPLETEPVIEESKGEQITEEKPAPEAKKAERPARKPSEKNARKGKGAPVDRQAKEAKKLARLKRAYDTGKITREYYIENLKKMSAPIPPEFETPAGREERVEAEPEATAEAAAKEEVPPEKPEASVEATPPVLEAPREEPAPGPSETEIKAGKLRAAYEDGRIPRDVYVGNLKLLGVPVPPELEPLPREEPKEVAAPPTEEAFVEEPAAGPSATEVKVERLKAAYEAGRIQRDVYIKNLKSLGMPLPEGLAEGEEIAEEIQEAVSPVEAEAAVEVTEEAVEEEATEAEEEAPAEEAVEPEQLVSKGELEAPERHYRGVAIASAGGLVYVLIWLLFIPMLGNFISALVLMLGALLIVVGYNVATSDAAAAARARMFNCPLCDERLDLSVTECSNCGAKFSD